MTNSVTISQDNSQCHHQEIFIQVKVISLLLIKIGSFTFNQDFTLMWSFLRHYIPAYYSGLNT